MKKYRPINKPAPKSELGKLPNQAIKAKNPRDRPVSKALIVTGAKLTSEQLAADMAACNVPITYVPAKGHKQKLVAKAKQKATPKMHYSKFIKQQPSKGK